MKNTLIFKKGLIPKYRLIMLHGWGSDAESMRYFSDIFTKNINLEFEVLSLNAPYPLSYPHCIENPSGLEWYKLYPDDWNQATEEVFNLIYRIKKITEEGLPIEKTFLMGFSQGASMAIEAGCSLNLKGIIGFGGYGNPQWSPPQIYPQIYLSHGLKDSIVIFKEIKDLINLFNDKDKIFLSQFDGGHEMIESEIIKLTKEIIKNL